MVSLALATKKTNRETAPAARRISILGSTGSVGTSTLDLVRQDPSRFEIVALTAHANWQDLIRQAKEFRPKFVAIADKRFLEPLTSELVPLGIECAAGPEALCEAAARDADWVMAAIVGAAGLAPTLEAARRGATVALANKECLVCAGDLFLQEADRFGAKLLPVDSEHNAIFQVLDASRPEAVERLILTASGGPFRSATLDEMAAATPEQAAKHPRWSMGAKISIDSATMMNKGLEIIEASYLFGMEESRIEVLVHPESIVHSLVAYIDGSVLAQLGIPDMRTPIAHTLAWPARMRSPAQRLHLADIGKLTFEAPNTERFPALSLARECLQHGRGAPTVLNAANEVAVEAFLNRRIGFLDIARVVRAAVDGMSRNLPNGAPSCLADIWELDSAARQQARDIIERLP